MGRGMGRGKMRKWNGTRRMKREWWIRSMSKLMTWDVTPRSLVEMCQRLEGMCCACHRSRRWQHVRPNCQYLHNKLNDVTCQKKRICTLRSLQSPVSHNFYLRRTQVWHAVSPNTLQVPLLKPAEVPPPHTLVAGNANTAKRRTLQTHPFPQTSHLLSSVPWSITVTSESN